MKHFLYLLVIIVFCSCNPEKKQVTNQAIIPTPSGLEGLQKSTSVASVNQNTSKTLIFNPPHGEAGHTCSLAVGAPLNQAAVTQAQQNTVHTEPVAVSSNITGKKLNPKHGEPGHRCDIAVGAPLDSKPTQITPKQTIHQSVVTTKPSEKLNPKHGESGHRCDIAVGAPLNSKPVQTVNVANTSTPALSAEVNTTETQNGVKLNPKHGEPGHRCDIAVGAPLG